MLTSKKELVQRLADSLLEKEVLDQEALEKILGPRPYKSQELLNIDKFRLGFARKTDEATVEATEKSTEVERKEGEGGEEDGLAGTIVAT